MKKLFYLTASVLCLGLAACGGGKTDPDPKPGPGPDVTPVAVTGVKLSQETAELQVGDKLKLSATVSPSDATDKTVTWASSNTSVASVAGGEVTALAAGSTDITATAGGITATCKVTVKEVDVPYVFSLDPKSVDLSAEGGDFVITVTCTGGYHMQSKPDWITEKSVNDKKHTFTAAANETTEERSGVIVFCDDVGTCLPVQVKQEAGDEPYDGPFTIDPSQVELPAEGGEFQVTVLCSGGYHINSKPDWVTEVSVSHRVHTFNVAENPSTEARSGIIVFCDDVGTCLPVRVMQSESPSTEAGAGTEDVTDGSPVNW